MTKGRSKPVAQPAARDERLSGWVLFEEEDGKLFRQKRSVKAFGALLSRRRSTRSPLADECKGAVKVSWPSRFLTAMSRRRGEILCVDD